MSTKNSPRDGGAGDNRIVSGVWADDAWAGPMREAERRSQFHALAHEWDDIVHRFGELEVVREGSASWRGASNSRAHGREIEMIATAKHIQDRLWNLCS